MPKRIKIRKHRGLETVAGWRNNPAVRTPEASLCDSCLWRSRMTGTGYDFWVCTNPNSSIYGIRKPVTDCRHYHCQVTR